MTAALTLQMALVGALLFAMLLTGDVLHRRGLVEARTIRSLDHIGAGFVALALRWAFDEPLPVVFLAAPFAALMAWTMWLGGLASVHSARRASVGAVLFPTAIALTALVTWDRPPTYAVAILALTLGDAAAALAGYRWGAHPYHPWGELKTWEGTAAAFATTALCTVLVLLVGGTEPAPAMGIAIYVAGAVAAVEGALPWGLDDLGVPLAGAAALEATVSTAPALALLAAALLLFAAATLPARRGGQVTARTTTNRIGGHHG